MNDKSNNLGEKSQDQTNDNSLNQANQHNQAEEGSTYWESNEVQDAYNPQVQNLEVDYSQYSQNNQQETNSEYSSQYELPPKKKSRKKPLLAMLLTLVILLVTAATAYGFSDTIRNSVDMLIKSPKDYYAHIENKSIESSVDKSIAFLKLSKDNKNIATEASAKLSYDKDTVGALLQNFAGMSISDMEALVGIPLDSLGFDIVSANSDKDSYQKIKLNLNDLEIISGELFIDNAAKELLIRLPELSSAYLSQSLDMSDYGMDDIDLDRYNELVDKLSSDSTGEFIKRYTKIITNEIDDVKLTKNEKLVVGNITTEANKLTVTIYPETLMKIYTKILDEAKNDEYILDLLPLFDVTREEYLETIDMAMENIQLSMDKLTDNEEIIKMLLYVGADGKILGRKIEFIGHYEDSVSINSFNVEQNNKGAYEFYISNELEMGGIYVTGSHSIENGAYTGSGKLKVDSMSSGPAEIDFEYSGVKTAIKNKHLYTYGNIRFSSYEMMGMEIELDFDVKEDEQLFNIMLNMGKSSLVTLETSTKYIKNFSIPKLDSNANIYDLSTEAEVYALTVDIEGYLSSLSDRLGVDLRGLLGGLLPLF